MAAARLYRAVKGKRDRAVLFQKGKKKKNPHTHTHGYVVCVVVVVVVEYLYLLRGIK
jgi:hypothetical protein